MGSVPTARLVLVAEGAQDLGRHMETTLTVPDPEFATSPVMFAETPLGAEPTAVAGQSVA